MYAFAPQEGQRANVRGAGFGDVLFQFQGELTSLPWTGGAVSAHADQRPGAPLPCSLRVFRNQTNCHPEKKVRDWNQK